MKTTITYSKSLPNDAYKVFLNLELSLIISHYFSWSKKKNFTYTNFKSIYRQNQNLKTPNRMTNKLNYDFNKND